MLPNSTKINNLFLKISFMRRTCFFVAVFENVSLHKTLSQSLSLVIITQKKFEIKIWDTKERKIFLSVPHTNWIELIFFSSIWVIGSLEWHHFVKVYFLFEKTTCHREHSNNFLHFHWNLVAMVDWIHKPLLVVLLPSLNFDFVVGILSKYRLYLTQK